MVATVLPDGVGRILELWKTIGRSSHRTKFLSFPQRDMNLRKNMSNDKKNGKGQEPETPEFWVSVSVVELQPLEKVEEQFLFFQGCSPMKHSGIILA